MTAINANWMSVVYSITLWSHFMAGPCLFLENVISFIDICACVCVSTTTKDIITAINLTLSWPLENDKTLNIRISYITVAMSMISYLLHHSELLHESEAGLITNIIHECSVIYLASIPWLPTWLEILCCSNLQTCV